MKVFQWREIEAARQHAKEGGQALHLHRIIVDKKKAPMCFVRAVERGESIAHLFDQDVERLRRTVRQLGVRVVVVEDAGSEWQHVDLCGWPLRRAMDVAARKELPDGPVLREGS